MYKANHCGYCGLKQSLDSTQPQLRPCEDCETILYCSDNCEVLDIVYHRKICRQISSVVSDIDELMKIVLNITDDNGHPDIDFYDLVFVIYDFGIEYLVLRLVRHAKKTKDRFALQGAKDWLMFLESYVCTL